MSNWTEEQYQNYINQGKGKVEAKRLANIDTINKKVDLFNNDASNKTTLFDVTEIDNTTDKYKTITLYLSGNPMPKQSYRSGVKRFKLNGTHTCPWTNKPVEHKAGDVFVYKNKNTGKVDVIPTAYQDKKYEDRIKEYRIMINNQLPKDFVMFTSEVHIVKLEFIFSPLKSFSKKILDGLQNKTLLKYKTSRPDLPDNLKKLILDSMSKIVYEDDGLICTENNVVKRYGWKPGVIIELKGF
jgi:Holliday junction resolvase RusA-like endonuclease